MRQVLAKRINRNLSTLIFAIAFVTFHIPTNCYADDYDEDISDDGSFLYDRDFSGSLPTSAMEKSIGTGIIATTLTGIGLYSLSRFANGSCEKPGVDQRVCANKFLGGGIVLTTFGISLGANAISKKGRKKSELHAQDGAESPALDFTLTLVDQKLAAGFRLSK